MITVFRRDPEQGWSYREAWYDETDREFVVHHGIVGTNGQVTAEPAHAEEARALMEGFEAQCREDGFSTPDEEQLHRVAVMLPLRTAEPSASERRNADQVHRAVLVGLAWKGLGALSDPQVQPLDTGGHALVMTARTVHRRKAREAVHAAVKSTDVPPSKVSINVS
ncbi:hypothetical protein [Nesterenkonia aerolata]|uniref:DNA-binding WGR domain protein n=1 Tax=Nesterenkonia aerolata TaxID=3074079 RepID=A0ABU2DRK8_9MICC|nr:hypothetical protein [Nesterenkonia sp. LY-0111]MDR8019118.1 hypothetical protein [Nesterenkonia sp. LY-0111]